MKIDFDTTAYGNMQSSVFAVSACAVISKSRLVDDYRRGAVMAGTHFQCHA